MAEDGRAGIRSVEVAGAILRALIAAGRPVPLKELARLARLHPGKTHRYLVSLTRTELVHQDPVSGHYGVGPMAVALGLVGLRSSDVVRAATALLPGLRDAINETVLLALWSPQGPVVFDLEEASRPVYMNIRVGSILPLLRTATGRVFAAFLPAEATAPLLAAERAEAPPGALWADAAWTAGMLAGVRTGSVAAIRGDLVPGVAAIAAPVFDHKGRIAAVIGALGRTEELDAAPGGAVAAALTETAAAISRRLGHG